MLTDNQQIFEQIKKADHILITFNKTWSGDAVASALAFFLFLAKMDKTVDIAAEKFSGSELYSFLPDYQKINFTLEDVRRFVISLDTRNAKAGKIKYKIDADALKFIISPQTGFFTPDDVKAYAGEFKYDLIIVLDTPDLESIGALYENNSDFFYKVPLINIDHHAENESFGQINRIELTSIATAEILFDLFSEYSRDLVDETIATCLLTGIISKTKSFKTQNLTPHALAASAQLIAMGAEREKIVNRLYRSRSLSTLKLWGHILTRLVGTMDNKLIWTVLSASDFIKTGSDETDLNDVIDELIVNIPQAHIIIILYEKTNVDKSANAGGSRTVTKALVYSLKNINALDITKEWNSVGTKNLAKISINKDINEAENEIINNIKNFLNKLSI